MPLIVNLVAPPSATQSGTLTSGSPTVTGLADTSLLCGALFVKGAGIPAGTCVLSIDSATQVTLNANATATGPASLAFALEPVTLAEAKLHLRVTIPDDDAYIAGLIRAARRLCETYEKVSYLPTSWRAVYDGFPFGGGYYNRQLRQFYGAFPGAMGATFPGFLPTNTGILELPRAPLVTVSSIVYLDSNGNTETLDPSNYVAAPGAPGRVSPAYGKIWPTTLPQIGAVQVNFVAGYGATADDVPDNVKVAVKLLVGHLYENREEVAAGVSLAELPLGVAALLGPETWGGYA